MLRKNFSEFHSDWAVDSMNLINSEFQIKKFVLFAKYSIEILCLEW